MRLAIIGLGYVGLANAILLAQHHDVIGMDKSVEKTELIKKKISPIKDSLIEKYLTKKNLLLTVTTNFEKAITDAELILIATPTNYDEKSNFFDTSSIESSIQKINRLNPGATIVIKSTVPVGFTEKIKKEFGVKHLFFSPEFLREGYALYDNLYPSRIIIGDKSKEAKHFSKLLTVSGDMQRLLGLTSLINWRAPQLRKK